MVGKAVIRSDLRGGRSQVTQDLINRVRLCCLEENTGCCGGHGKLLRGRMVLNEKVEVRVLLMGDIVSGKEQRQNIAKKCRSW